MAKLFQLLLVCILFGGTAVANASTNISPAMLEQLKQLPRAEQERLAREHGFDLQQLQSRSSASTSQQRPETLQPRQQSESTEQSKREKSDEPKRFGLNLFDSEVSTFAPVGNIPVPDNYVLGPDDEVLLQFFGNRNQSLHLQVSRDGYLSIPEIGQLQVAGLPFSKARELIRTRVQQSMIGVEAAVSMGALRTINIMVAGEAKHPGSYTVSALTTVTQALFVAGGVSDIGALRSIRVNRAGNTITNFDLYDLLLRGDSSNDIHLQNGDVVFVAPIQALAQVRGEVRRPALFEVQPGDTLGSLLAMAGGAREGAFPKAAVLERFNAQHLRDLQNVDLTQASVRAQAVRAGDVLRIGATSTRAINSVTVAGAVVRPGHYAWRDGLRVSDLLPSLWSDLLMSTDLDYALVVRERDQRGTIEVHQFNLGKAIEHKGSPDDLQLAARDTLLVFHHASYSHQRYKLNDYLRKQLEERFSGNEEDRWLASDELASRSFELLQSEQQDGTVSLNALMLNEQLVQQQREQQQKSMQQQVLAEVMSAFLQELFTNESYLAKSVHLTRSELLYPLLSTIRHQARHGQPVDIVSVSGEVKVPGDYPLAQNAGVAHLVKAAGGLNDSAFIQRAELSRVSTVAAGSGSRVQHYAVSLPSHLNGSEYLALQSRDRLNIFSIPDWNNTFTVELKGEVRFPGRYSIQQGETLSSVLQRAGGLTQNAFAKGAVFTREHIREREKAHLQKMVEQLRGELATRSLSTERAQNSPQDMLLMLQQIEAQSSLGRLVVNLPYILAEDPTADMPVQNGDVLYVPRMDSTIAIMGEVQHASTHRFNGELSVDDYLNMAGGLRQRADGNRVFVIRADGSVVLPRNGWLRGRRASLEPGDTIIVPLDTEYKDNLTLWSQVTQIFYQSAVALAAISRI
ncbi:SLBB domain-containing protein [Alkalimonas mucilaginosa]|uniref:SLBB domain-containing protein n=1 Tax=Alkalimonas mucilaginosa TaxID=3057676 RepID=A0ABU7JBJ4_9GAMM|nr:SLBB domain-containing protein [Alkalimonas sp. MEB004]MEE2023019.1 SLBB domain-containing protein [Alkalimonas sp. MEB004]